MKNVLFLPIGGMNTASSRLICYENAKYLKKLGWDVKVGNLDVNAFDIVVFQKRFRRKDFDLLRKVKGKVVLQISEAYYCKDPGWYHNITQFMKRANAVVVGSKPIHDWFSHKHHVKSVIIPTGLDFAALPKGKREGMVKVCWIGNTGNERYLDQVVKPINALPHRPHFEFRVIGGRQPHLPFTRRMHFIQWQLGKAERQVSECHIGIAPLHCKPYEFAKPPSKPVLYMAQGLAVIATDTPAYRSLIRDGINGFLIKNNDQARWTRVLGKLIKYPSFRNQIAAQGAVACKRFDAPNIAKHWDAFLRRL